MRSGRFDPNAVDYDGRTPLHIAAGEGHEDLVRQLLTECGVSINVKDRYGHTPLRDALNGRHAGIVSVLMDSGAVLGMPPSELALRLCDKVAHRQLEDLRLWHRAVPDWNVCDYDGRTPLHVVLSGERGREGERHLHIRTSTYTLALTLALLGGKKGICGYCAVSPLAQQHGC
jgi:ankyrin repeat protein